MDSLSMGTEVFGFGVWVLTGQLAGAPGWLAGILALELSVCVLGLPVFSGVSVVIVLLLLHNPQ